MIHPESFAINYIKFNFSSLPDPHFSFFSTMISDWPSHFHTFPHYSVGRSGPMSTLFIIIMSHCASRHIRPPCCLTNTFCLVQLLQMPASQLFHPALFRSFSTVLLQAVFGLPLALRPLGVIWYTTCTLFYEDSLY